MLDFIKVPFLHSSYDCWSNLPKRVVKHCGENKQYLLFLLYYYLLSFFLVSTNQGIRAVRQVGQIFFFTGWGVEHRLDLHLCDLANKPACYFMREPITH